MKKNKTNKQNKKDVAKTTKKVEKQTENNINKKVFIVIYLFIVFVLLLILISSNFGTYNVVKLKKNNNNIFSVSDLTVGNLKFSDNEKTVVKELGKPIKTKNKTKGIYKYKIFYYKGLTLTLKENYNDFILVKSEITSRKYKTSRNIKVNNKVLKVMKKYRVDNTKGTYLYGNYTVDSLGNNKINDNIYMGLRSTKEVVYINKDASFDDINGNIAKLTFSYDKGRVKKIVWSYDVE